MKCSVLVTKSAAKDLRKVPAHIIDKLEFWIDGVENKGLTEMQKIKRYRDHALKGDRSHQRSISLNILWRAIYELDTTGEMTLVSIEEVTPHRY